MTSGEFDREVDRVIRRPVRHFACMPQHFGSDPKNGTLDGVILLLDKDGNRPQAVAVFVMDRKEGERLLFALRGALNSLGPADDMRGYG